MHLEIDVQSTDIVPTLRALVLSKQRQLFHLGDGGKSEQGNGMEGLRQTHVSFLLGFGGTRGLVVVVVSETT